MLVKNFTPDPRRPFRRPRLNAFEQQRPRCYCFVSVDAHRLLQLSVDA